MRSSFLRIACAAVLSVSLLFSGCSGTSSGTGNIPDGDIIEDRFTPSADRIADFSSGAPDGFWARNDRGNGHPFNCSFKGANAVIDNSLLTLHLTAEDGRYAGAEYRSFAKFSYGYYSASMKAAACSGVISSFFTYTGRPWDEIDIEFLGDDTTRVQFNYYNDGKGGHEYVYELGFDASLDFHEYGFDWQADSITWYVDGRSVYRAEASIPSHSGYIMMNLWNVADTNADWAGKFTGEELPVTAEYQWIGYKSAE